MATYGSEAGVEAITNINIGAATVPTTTQVTVWLAQGYAIINQELAGGGYVIPVGASAALYAQLTHLNDLWASAYTLRARGLESRTGEVEARSDQYLEEFWEMLKRLLASDLTQVGASLQATTKRRRIRSMQLRRVDGYSGTYEGDYSEYDNVSD